MSFNALSETFPTEISPFYLLNDDIVDMIESIDEEMIIGYIENLTSFFAVILIIFCYSKFKR